MNKCTKLSYLLQYQEIIFNNYAISNYFTETSNWKRIYQVDQDFLQDFNFRCESQVKYSTNLGHELLYLDIYQLDFYCSNFITPCLIPLYPCFVVHVIIQP